MPNPYLRVTMPDGSVWRVEAERVRRHERTSEGWEARAVRDPSFLPGIADWARFCLPWPSLGAVQLSPPVPVDYAEAWKNAKVEVCDE